MFLSGDSGALSLGHIISTGESLNMTTHNFLRLDVEVFTGSKPQIVTRTNLYWVLLSTRC